MSISKWASRFRYSTRVFSAVGVASTGFFALGGAHAATADTLDMSEPSIRELTLPERVSAIRARLEENRRLDEGDPALQRLAQFVNFPNFPNFPNAFPNFPNAMGPRPMGPPGFPNFPNFPNAPR